MTVFNTDLDNTIIFSYKHDIGEKKRCVEIYQGRQISFITDKTFDLLKKIQECVLFVPTTTRTAEQYNRIDLGIGRPEYALVCNGGILLENGKEDEMWYKESLRMTEHCTDELKCAEKFLTEDNNRCFEVRNIRELFVFTKSKDPVCTVENLKSKLNTQKMDVFSTGIKVYAVPKSLSKGIAIDRLRKKLNAKKIIAAGDSEFDVSMLKKADIPLAPKELARISVLPKNTLISKNEIFSEFVLSNVLKLCSEQPSVN